MTSIELKAPAKINLWLDITSKRPDGYHDIESVMQTVTLFDRLTIGRSGGHGINVSCSIKSLACDETNLCHRAAKAFFEKVGFENPVSIYIEKQIPIAAGLAGGSTDAAATLIGLNELFSAGLSEAELCALGSTLGADVPFCIRRGISVTRGIGDRFSNCPPLAECFILIACDGEGVSTPWAYHRLDEMYDFSKRQTDVGDFTSKLGGPLESVASAMSNIFESAVLPVRERAAKLKAAMLEKGALGALMSGSGPAVFGIYSDLTTAQKAAADLRNDGISAFICTPYYENK